MHAPCPAHGVPPRRILQQLIERPRECGCISRGNEKARFAVHDHVGDAAGVIGNDGRFTQQRLGGDEPEPFADRWYGDDGRLAIEARQFGLWSRSVPGDAIGNAQCPGLLNERGVVGTVADNGKARFHRHAPERVHQPGDAFLSVEPTHEQNASVVARPSR